MTLAPFFDAPAIIQVHIVAALVALVLGPIAMLRRRRDLLHRVVGRLWVASMAATAISSFFIYTIRLIGPFSPIHALSVVTLIGLWAGVSQIRAGQVADHRSTMVSVYVFGMGIPGLFTLLPGRLMNAILFPSGPVAGFAGALAVFCLVVLVWGIRRPDHIRLLVGRA